MAKNKWNTSSGSPGGDVTAGANITDNSIVRGDGGAKGIQGSGAILDDSDNLSGVGTIGSGAITSTGAVEGTTITDGTATITSGAINSVTSFDSTGIMTVNRSTIDGNGAINATTAGVIPFWAKGAATDTTTSNFSGSRFRVENTNSTTNNYSQIEFLESNSQGVGGIVMQNIVHSATVPESQMVLSTRNGASIVQGLTIDKAGAIRLNTYGAGTLVSDSSGNITAGTGNAKKTFMYTFSVVGACTTNTPLFVGMDGSTHSYTRVMGFVPPFACTVTDMTLNVGDSSCTNDVDVVFKIQAVASGTAYNTGTGTTKAILTHESGGTLGAGINRTASGTLSGTASIDAGNHVHCYCSAEAWDTYSDVTINVILEED
jgi:hypothetical protein